MKTKSSISETLFKYLSITQIDKNFGLSVNTVGFELVKPYSCYPVLGHPNDYNFVPKSGRRLKEYQVIYFLDGEGYFKSESISETKIEKGTLLILFPGQWHTYHPIHNKGWKVFYIGFEGSIIDNMHSKNFFIPGKPFLQVGHSETLIDLFTRSVEIVRSEGSLSQQRLAGIVINILSESLFLSEKKARESNNNDTLIEHAKAIMLEKYDADLNMEALASSLCISYSKFRKFFKECTGHSPSDYFQELKIRKAKELLLESNLTLKEISYNLNFCTCDYFIARFKKRTGISPNAFKRQFQSR